MAIVMFNFITSCCVFDANLSYNLRGPLVLLPYVTLEYFHEVGFHEHLKSLTVIVKQLRNLRLLGHLI